MLLIRKESLWQNGIKDDFPPFQIAKKVLKDRVPSSEALGVRCV